MGEILGDLSGEANPVVENTATRERDQWTISAPTPWDTSSFAGLRAILREDRETWQASGHVPGRQALAVHRLGESLQSGGIPRPLRGPASVLHKLMKGYLRNFLGFEINRSARLGRRVKFHHQHGIVIDPLCVIGDDCVFVHGVTLTASHEDDLRKSRYSAPQVGSGVRFGTGCIVLGGVRIGDGATIGPNAVVTTDIPPGASVIAHPPRVLRLR